MSIRNQILMGIFTLVAVTGIVLTIIYSPDAGITVVLITNIILFGVVIFQRQQLGKVQQRVLRSLRLENVMLPKISARSAKILQRVETLDRISARSAKVLQGLETLDRISARSAKILQRLETLDSKLPKLEEKVDNTYARITTKLERSGTKMLAGFEEKIHESERKLGGDIAALVEDNYQANDNLTQNLSVSDKKIIGLLHAQQLHMERLNARLESLEGAPQRDSD